MSIHQLSQKRVARESGMLAKYKSSTVASMLNRFVRAKLGLHPVSFPFPSVMLFMYLFAGFVFVFAQTAWAFLV